MEEDLEVIVEELLKTHHAIERDGSCVYGETAQFWGVHFAGWKSVRLYLYEDKLIRLGFEGRRGIAADHYGPAKA